MGDMGDYFNEQKRERQDHVSILVRALKRELDGNRRAVHEATASGHPDYARHFARAVERISKTLRQVGAL